MRWRSGGCVGRCASRRNPMALVTFPLLVFEHGYLDVAVISRSDTF